MPIWIDVLERGDGNEGHLLEKGITRDEARDVLYEVDFRNFAFTRRTNRIVFGRTGAGWYLAIGLLPLGRGWCRPVTGWQLNGTERRTYLRATGGR